MPLNAQTAGFLQQLADMGAKPFHTMTPTDCRVAFDTLLTAMPPSKAKVAKVEDRTIPGPSGKIAVRVYTPEGQGPFPVLVYFHGGGFVIGSLNAYDILCRELTGGSGAVVVSVDYRLSPEHKFPAAPDDCWAATRWIASNAAELGGDASRIAVGGDSAGANLATVTAIRARDEGGPKLCAQLLIYPVASSGPPSKSMLENAQGYLLEKADMEWFVGHYVKSPMDLQDPRLAPSLTKDLSRLPPALVQTCEFDPLRDEGDDYAAALKKAGTPVVHSRYEGAIHGTLCFVTALDLGRTMLDEETRWLREQFRRA
ncbi:MAG TPA: alpha/beta hydrolase [Nevskiaceae bacterium]|nr:alpha/beta hydrolase [Nevskiaceae bacterium]